MVSMRQLLFIHGGSVFDNRDELLDQLRTWELEDPFQLHEERGKWKNKLPEALGERWRCAFPQMPNKFDAKYAEWAVWFERHLPFVEDGIVLIGHSLGATFLCKWLSENQFPKSIAQLHLVAPGWSEGEFMLPNSLEAAQKQCNEVHIWHSHDDPVCAFEKHALRYAVALPSAITHWMNGRGHFRGEEFSEIVEVIKSA